MTAPAKVEQRHRDEAENLVVGYIRSHVMHNSIAQALANAEQRGREAEREECVRAVENIDVDANPQLCDAHTLWGACSDAIRARGQRKEGE